MTVKKKAATKKKKKKVATKKKTKKKTRKKAASEVRAVTAELVDESAVSSPPSEKPSSSLPAVVDEGGKALTTHDPVTTYLAELRKYPVLTKEQENEIAIQYYDTKDPALAEILVTSNLRFVVKVAAEYAKFGSKLIDLIQEGNVGLMHAVKEFNPYKGVRLITYAVWWIRGYIQEYLMRQYSMVRIGTTQSQRKLFYQLQREKKALEASGEPSDVKALSERLNVSEADVMMMTERMSGRDVSLNQPLDDDSQATLMDLQTSSSEDSIDEQLGHMELLERLLHDIDKIRGNLNERETFLLENRLLADEPMTLQEIGDKYGVTREAVRQMEARLMKKIKDVFLEGVIHQAGKIDTDKSGK